MEKGVEEDDDVLFCHTSPPPTKRLKIDLTGEDQDEPLRCSTPQPDGAQENCGEDADLDTTLEDFGISHDSIDMFIDETSQEGCVEDGYAEAFLREEAEQRRGCEVGATPDILEDILSQLPISHLYGSCRLVCRQWNGIILREKFLYWKKLYYMYKSGRCAQSRGKVASLTEKVWSVLEHENTTLEHLSLPLVRFVCKQFTGVEVGEDSEKALHLHPQSSCVVRIRELFPSLQDTQQHVVETALLLVLCSKSVHEVLSVVTTLLTTSACKRVEIMELFYCMATLLLAGSHEKKQWPMRVHYNMFYALNVTERSPSGLTSTELIKQPASGQQSIHRYCDSTTSVLTAEQAQVVNYRMEPGEVVKVMAFAGTGKTTTLLRFTALNPHMSFLYCVFNKSVQEHASTLFPRNVRCRTFHSLAHGSRGDPLAVGWKYLSKRGTVSPYTVSQSVKNWPKDRQPLLNFSRHVYQTLGRFIASGDNEAMDSHIPTTVKRRVRRIDECNAERHQREVITLRDPAYRVHVLRETCTIWHEMIDKGDTQVRMTDDGYLKLFQLSQPQIIGYDCILVDEAQDLTPAIISLISCQSCAKIFVGDTHQQIYGFRGATNALEQIRTNRVFHLTESFRFGPEIAYVAACILSVLKDVWRQTLVGSTHVGVIDGTIRGQVAIIARMNATLFEEMVKTVTVRSDRSIKIGFAGGIQKYEFDMYLDIHKLLCGRKEEIKHKFIKRWKSFMTLSQYAEKADDVALINKLKICQKYQQELPSLIEKIKSLYSPNMALADIVFSTAHKSKGLEFDTVKLTDDYSIYEDEDRHGSGDDNDDIIVLGGSKPRPPDTEEANILYVAVTRAKRNLILTSTLARVMREAKEYFVYPSMESSELSEGVCSVCQVYKPYPPLHLQSQNITVTGAVFLTRRGFKAGMVCTQCSALTLPFLHTTPNKRPCTV